MIIKTLDGRFFRVRETGCANLGHVWYGREVSRRASKSVVFPGYVYTAKTSLETLVRKTGSVVVEPRHNV